MRKCPTCGKPVEWPDNPWRPFCSERCKLIDFGRWTNEEYRVPVQQPDEQPVEESSEGETRSQDETQD